jgi:predicted nucleic acid-binding protein
MKLLLDINVLLDVVLAREPWAEAAAQLLATVESGEATGLIAGHTLTTVHYIVEHQEGRRKAVQAVTDLLRIVEVIPIEKSDFHQALAFEIKDFEDAVQAAAGLKVGADYVVTRNEKDFRSSPVPTSTPATILSLP